jgi:hypothetical protein
MAGEARGWRQPGLPGRGLAVGRGGQRDGGLLPGLSPTLDRWTNLVLAGLEVVSIVASAVGETWASSWLLSSTESALLLLIVWYAWTWSRQGGNTTLKAANLLVGSPLAAEPPGQAEGRGSRQHRRGNGRR